MSERYHKIKRGLITTMLVNVVVTSIVLVLFLALYSRSEQNRDIQTITNSTLIKHQSTHTETELTLRNNTTEISKTTVKKTAYIKIR
jgi:hypothetical protein